MEREFVITKEFDKQWAHLGLNDEDMAELENLLLQNPKSASVIQGTGGVRKIRFSRGNKGKSGGVRILYIDYEIYEVIYLLTVYAKSEMENITAEDKIYLKNLSKIIEKNLGGDKK